MVFFLLCILEVIKLIEIFFFQIDAERAKLEGFSGEWLYPRSYICSACPATCSNIWDIFYHKWNVHPNVLCHHYDIPLEQLPSQKWVIS